jgi:uncharacterized Zn finger protein
MKCPTCGSTDDFVKAGIKRLARNRSRQMYQCRKCGGYVSGEVKHENDR